MRIGAVSYLNTKPLVYGLADLAPQHELVFDLPSRLADDLANGKNIVFCATGISDSALLRGVKSKGTTAITHSILMRAKSKTVRLIRAMHNLQNKTIRLRSDKSEHLI